MEYRLKHTDELYHYGVRGMKWGVRKSPGFIQRRRQATIRSASELAAKRSKMYGQDSKYYSNDKNRKQASKADMQRWRKASDNAKKYFDSKRESYSSMTSSKISHRQVKDAKKWMKSYSFHTEAEYADVYQKGKTSNYLNDLSEMDKRRRR